MARRGLELEDINIKLRKIVKKMHIEKIMKSLLKDEIRKQNEERIHLLIKPADIADLWGHIKDRVSRAYDQMCVKRRR